MLKQKALSRSMRVIFSGGLLLGVGMFASPVFAQEKTNVVEVTGTRIKAPGTTSSSPISSIGVEEIKSAQPIAVEEFFKNLPAAVPAIGPATNNGTGGGATIDLRGLGSNRTLVLVNGRRMVPFNLSGSVDTNSIPIALLDRVDLVTGGASAVYGADAVSGVVNFNLKKKFEGFDLSSSFGSSGERDAKRNRTDVTMGGSFADGRGNAVLSLGKTHADPLQQAARDYGKISTSSATGAFEGSGTTVPARISVIQGKTGTTALAGNWVINPTTGTLTPYTAANSFNFNPVNYYVTGLDRTQATALANFKINSNFEAYAEMFSTGSKVSSTLAESGSFLNVYNVPIGNPFLPEPARQQICARQGITAANCVVGNTTLVPMTIGRRFVEMGPRFNDFDNKTLQTTLGLRGDLPYDWTYDAYWSRGNADQTQIRRNWGSFSKLGQALNAVSTTACVNPANGCVPLNIFGAAGSITPAMINFVNLSAILMQSVEQNVLSASASGDLGKLIVSPLAKSPINMAFGAEKRKMTAANRSDAAAQIQGEVLGAGAPLPDRSGSFTMSELFVESSVPLIKDLPFAKAVNLELGYRQTEFATKGTNKYSSYKYGGEWEPVQSIRFRAMAQKATRAPNINELYAPLVSGLSNLSVDPCQLALVNQGQANTAGTLSNLCRLTGVPANALGSLSSPSAGQINNQSGGNPNLGPEEAKTKTIGFVWEPLPKLAISLDYYKIAIDKAVSSPSTTDILDDCYNPTRNTGLVLNAACAQVQRSPITGTFNGVDAPGVLTPLSNQGKQATSGFDLNVAYQAAMKDLGLDAKLGTLNLSFGANQVQSYTFQATPASINRDCLGFYSIACGAPNYKRKFNQRTAWNVSDFAFSYNWRYMSAVAIEPLATGFFPAYTKIDAYSYVDLGAVWNVSKMIRVNLSVTNLFDKTPPFVGGTIGTTGTNSGNTFPQTYDAVGRYFSVGASLKF